MTNFFKPVSMAALFAAASFAAGGAPSAYAADLGGDCCADLEERVAELEATTARKGNRKVSLEVSGQVNEALMYWDDGAETNVYQVTNDNSRSRFRFKGKAKITDDWEGGYLLEIGVRGANSKRTDQFSDEGSDSHELDVRHSFWYLKSKTYGQVTVGQTNTATQDITEINLSQTGSFAKYSDVEDSGLGMRLRQGGSDGDDGLSAITWRRLIDDAGDQPGEGDRFNSVRYDSPTWMGFTVSAAWGEDDFADVAIRYAGEFNGVKLSAGFGYGDMTDGPDSGVQCLADDVRLDGGDAECHQYGGSISVLHEASGIFVNFAAGEKKDERIDELDVGSRQFAGTGVDDTSRFYAVQGGIEKKFNDLGKTTIYGEYYDFDGGGNAQRSVDAVDAVNPFFGTTSRIFETGVEMFGVGLAQGIDNAAMTVYLSYRHYEADLTVMRGTAGQDDVLEADLDDLDIVMSGAIIKF